MTSQQGKILQELCNYTRKGVVEITYTNAEEHKGKAVQALLLHGVEKWHGDSVVFTLAVGTMAWSETPFQISVASCALLVSWDDEGHILVECRNVWALVMRGIVPQEEEENVT